MPGPVSHRKGEEMEGDEKTLRRVLTWQSGWLECPSSWSPVPGAEVCKHFLCNQF